MSKKQEEVSSKPREEDFVKLSSSKNFQNDFISNINRLMPNVKVKHEKPKGTKKKVKEEARITSKGGILKPGRHPCDCEGTLHDVLTNCLGCGKIICEQERFGPCYFCKTEVQAPAPMTEKLKQDKLYARAVDLRNRLIEYDRSFERRTTVIDQQTDYFESETNVWLSETERNERKKKEDKLKELQQQQQQVRKKLQFTIDFAGRKILVEDSNKGSEAEITKMVKELAVSNAAGNSSSAAAGSKQPNALDVARSLVHPSVLGTKLKYKNPQQGGAKSKSGNSMWAVKNSESRVQHEYYAVDGESEDEAGDSEEEEVEVEAFGTDPVEEAEIVFESPSSDSTDQGMCLSMHQPWASLLVYGIKQHEGRTWPTDYRGRLWIASTKEDPLPETIASVEEQYRVNLKRTKGYPRHYPTGVLLGCVDLVDCLEQDEYKEKVPAELQESESDCVFMVKNPRRLVVPLAMLGKPKIYTLEPEMLRRAHTGLKPLPENVQQAAKAPNTA